MHHPQADKTEKKIQKAAITIFAAKGFNNTTLVDISRKAGVTKKSIYHYFTNKNQILSSLLEQVWQILADQMIELAENKELDPLEKIDKMIDQTIDIFTGKPKLAIVFFNEHNPVIRGNDDSLNAHYLNYLKAFAAIFNSGLREKYVHEHIDGKIFLFFVNGGLRSLINEWATHPKLFSLDEIREGIKYQIKHGILKW